MELVVFGATGGTGHHIVRQALDQGHRVTAVVRDPARLDIRHPELNVITNDLTDGASLRTALNGQVAGISALGPRTMRQARAGVTTSATRQILACGLQRLVAVSAGPVADVPEGESFLGRKLIIPLVSVAFRPVYTDLTAMEEEIRRSPLAWTIVRPPRLTNGPLTGEYQRVVGGNVARGRTISRADLAHAALTCLQDPAMLKQELGIAY